MDEALEQEIESISRAVAERLRRPYGDFAAGVTKQATRPAPAGLDRPRGHGSGTRLPRADGLRRRRPARPAGRAAAALAERARERADAGAAGADAAAGPARAAAVRRQRVGRGAGSRGSGRRRRRGRGDHLRPRVRDPRRSRRRARCRRAREMRSRRVSPSASASGCSRATSGGSRSSCSRSQARAGCGSRRLSPARAAWSRRGSPSVPGSSASFVGGVVAYADEVKRSELDVPEELLAEHGAVSAEVAAAMAEGARRRLDAGRRRCGHRRRGPRRRHPREARRAASTSTPPARTAPRPACSTCPGEREQIRVRATVTALHLLRALLTGSRDETA